MQHDQDDDDDCAPCKVNKASRCNEAHHDHRHPWQYNIQTCMYIPLKSKLYNKDYKMYDLFKNGEFRF